MKLPYPLLSDFPDLTTIHKYGVAQRVGKSGRVLARQSFFLIDKQGMVRGLWTVGEPTGGKFANDDLFDSGPIFKLARKLAEER